MEIISLIGAVQTFFYLLLFNSKPKKQPSDYVLLLFLFLLGLVFVDNYLRNTGFYETWPQYWGITYCLPMLIAPLMFYYVVLLTTPGQKIKPAMGFLVLPFIVFLVYFMATYYFLPVDQKVAYYREATSDPWAMIYAAEFFLIFSGPFYAIISLVRLRKHSRYIALSFSYTEGISLKWLKGVFSLVIAVNALMILSNILSDVIPVITYQTADNIVHATNVALVFFIGYKGFKQRLIYPWVYRDDQNLETDTAKSIKTGTNQSQKPRYEKSGLQDTDARILYTALVKLMEREELYLDGKLSIKTIADKMGVSVNHMSQVINQYSGKNFFRFVNEYRVEKAKTLLTDPASQKFKILAIAYECGFNSKSSFNTIFKEYTGNTPSEFTQYPRS
jgi:AraC-like DNA-binding protein